MTTITKKLVSGFTIEIQPLCPYYLDFLDLVYPYREHPKREIKLAAGDVHEIPFEPDENTSYEPVNEDYELYIRYIATDAYNADLDRIRERVREDYLLSTCVRVKDGPYDSDDEDWRQRMEAAFQERNWRLPKHPGEIELIFIKSIIRSTQERDFIIQSALYKEVSEIELTHALDMFQS